MSKAINEPQKILVVMHRALGDSVFGLSALSYLRTVFPKAKVTYALPRWITSLYQDVEIAAHQIFALELGSAQGVWKFYQHIRQERYDVVIELQQSGRTRKILTMAKHLLSFDYYYHNHHLRTGRFVFEQGVRKPISQRHLDTCYSFVRVLNPETNYPQFLDFLPQIKPTQSLGNKDQVILGIVASKEEKKWPLEHFAELIKKLALHHPGLTFLAPVSQSQEDQQMAAEFEKLTEGLAVKLVNLPLDQLPKVMSGSKIYIGNDTGLKHIAAAVGLRTVTFFGPEEPLEWHPYALDRHLYFWVHEHDARTQMSCFCLLKQFDQSRQLKEISADEVMKVLLTNDFL